MNCSIRATYPTCIAYGVELRFCCQYVYAAVFVDVFRFAGFPDVEANVRMLSDGTEMTLS